MRRSPSVPCGAGGTATPGHDCPGLIEARTQLTASDSTPALGSTPGHDCPGLIEAEYVRHDKRVVSHPSVSTPGHDCPGLIEATCSLATPEVDLRPEPTPGHDCPGLIEASKTTPRAIVDSHVPTPGHDCPGLIEAPPARSCAGASARSFPLRGMIAPASLKQLFCRKSSTHGNRNATPGHDCPGLIEAVERGEGTCPRRRDPVLPLRGMIAPASLKPLAKTRRRRLLGTTIPTPGHDCPGLIEATFCARACRNARTRTTPGHDCPGLIEARLARTNDDVRWRWPLRGMIAPASLKPRRGRTEPNSPCNPKPLRGMIAPASLKPSAPSDTVERRNVNVSATPGHDCPGLIEARGPVTAETVDDVSLTTPGHDCPGLIEATRREWSGPVASWRQSTPGHDCPGLIEAMSSRVPSDRTKCGSPLRGMIAPASLKQPHVDLRVRRAAASRPLRGMIAPASLKP